MNSEMLLIAQIIIDAFLVVCAFYLVVQLNKKNKTAEEKGIKGLLPLLEKKINDANAAARTIRAESEKGLNSSRELLEALEGKRVDLHGYLERIESVLKAMDEALPPKGTETAHLDRYKEASRLAGEGHGIDEIVKRAGLPKGEVQLIVGLKKK